MRYVFVFIHVVALEQISESIFTVNDNIVTSGRVEYLSVFTCKTVLFDFFTFNFRLCNFKILKQPESVFSHFN